MGTKDTTARQRKRSPAERAASKDKKFTAEARRAQRGGAGRMMGVAEAQGQLPEISLDPNFESLVKTLEGPSAAQDAVLAPRARHSILCCRGAVGTRCEGIDIGVKSGGVLGWAPDFSLETAARAIAELVGRHAQPVMRDAVAELADDVSEWAGVLARSARLRTR